MLKLIQDNSWLCFLFFVIGFITCIVFAVVAFVLIAKYSDDDDDIKVYCSRKSNKYL